MGKTPEDELRQVLADREVVVVVGSGVSLAATGGNPLAGWSGLLLSGVDRSEKFHGLKPDQAGHLRDLIGPGDLDLMLAAADVICSRTACPGGEFGAWLRETIGSLKATSTELLEAICALGVPIATTNYDNLLEDVSGLPPVTWHDEGWADAVAQGGEAAILHLHGHYLRPETVVLGLRSYDQVLARPHTQNVLQFLATARSLLFIGCGDGLDDPNFGRLLDWLPHATGANWKHHFRLCLDREQGDLRKLHPPGQRIVVLPYGDDYPELAGFLRSLVTVLPAAARVPPVAAALAPDLPPPPAHCIGRDAEVQTLTKGIVAKSPKPIAILGPAGIGKSTVSLCALHRTRVAKRYGDRRYFVRCDSAANRDGLISEIARTMGLVVTGEPEQVVLDTLRQAPAVLVLDNAETPWESQPQAVEELLGKLAAIPGLALVVSLRSEDLPADVAWTQPIRLGPLDGGMGRRAFLAIATRISADDPDLDHLLADLDGVPLAITLMAHVAQPETRLKGVLADWCKQKTRMLHRAGSATRLTNLELSYEFSWLSPRMADEARALLSLLALLPDGVADQDVDDIAAGNTEEALRTLHALGLVYEEHDRQRMLAPLREYVTAAHPPATAAVTRLVGHYVTLALEGDGAGAKGGAEVIARLAPEVGNVEAALLIALARHPHTTAVRAAQAWGEFARFSGFGSDEPLVHAAAHCRRTMATLAEANCIRRLGDIALARSDHDTARARYEQAVPLFQQVHDLLGEANCIKGLGDLALCRSEHATARARFEQALPLFQQVSDLLGQAFCSLSLGDLALLRSDHDTARTNYNQALHLYERADDLLGVANCIEGLGDFALQRSEHATARAKYDQALRLHRQVGGFLGEANCIKRLGDIALQRSGHDAARAKYEQALPLYRQVGSLLGEANCIQRLGDLALQRSDHDAARTKYEQALPLFQQVGDRYGQANCARGFGDVALVVVGAVDQAEQGYRAALTTWEELEVPDGQAECLRGLGDVAAARNDLDTARDLYQQALDLFARIPSPFELGHTHRRLARVAPDDATRNRHVQAARDQWTQADLPVLLAELDEEFGTADSPPAG